VKRTEAADLTLLAGLLLIAFVSGVAVMPLGVFLYYVGDVDLRVWDYLMSPAEWLCGMDVGAGAVYGLLNAGYWIGIVLVGVGTYVRLKSLPLGEVKPPNWVLWIIPLAMAILLPIVVQMWTVIWWEAFP
jgi:hypothetical protein